MEQGSGDDEPGIILPYNIDLQLPEFRDIDRLDPDSTGIPYLQKKPYSSSIQNYFAPLHYIAPMD